jgi:hypothetical protein
MLLRGRTLQAKGRRHGRPAFQATKFPSQQKRFEPMPGDVQDFIPLQT